MAKPDTTNPAHDYCDTSPIAFLRRRGMKVEAQDIPGLFRVNDGPEVTLRQLLGMALAEGAKK